MIVKPAIAKLAKRAVTYRVALIVVAALIVCGGAGALALRGRSNDAAAGIPGGTVICIRGSQGCQKPATGQTVAPTPSPASTPPGVPSAAATQPVAAKPSTSAPVVTSASNDTSAKYDQCNSANNAAGQKYSTAINQAQAAYDAVMAQWNAVKNQPAATHNPYSEYAAQAKSNYNAISVPAYAEYTATLNSLKSQGCQVIQVYADSSWK